MDHLPEHLTIDTPAGRYVYGYADGAPELVDQPLRKDGRPKRTPRYVEQAARHWAAAIAQIERTLAPRGDALRVLRETWAPTYGVVRSALQIGAPNARDHAVNLHKQIDKTARRRGVPADLREFAGGAAQQLGNLLERTRPPRRVNDDGPTAETAAKLQGGPGDPIERLHEAGKISDDQFAAAMEIRSIYEAVTRRLDAGARDYRHVRVQSSLSGPPDPAGSMPWRLAHLHRAVYRPWCAELRRQAAVPGRRDGRDRYRLVADVLFDQRGIRDLERSYGLRHGSGWQPIVQALDRYIALRCADPAGPLEAADDDGYPVATGTATS